MKEGRISTPPADDLLRNSSREARPHLARRLGYLGCVVSSVLLAVVGRSVFLWRRENLSDDAYYYLIVARHVVERGISTFDGEVATNGYHPLMLWLEAALLAMGSWTPLEQYRLVVLLSAVILFLAILGAALLVVHGGFRPSGVALLAGMCIFAGPNIRFLMGGMESTLVVPLLLLFLLCVQAKRHAVAAVLATLLVVSRLDTIVYVLPPLAVVLVALGDRHDRRSALLSVGIPAVFVVLYLLYNMAFFGHPMPIHGALKSSFPWPTVHLENVLGQGELMARLRYRPFDALLLTAGAVGLLSLPGSRPAPRPALWARTLIAVSVAQFVSFAFFQKWLKQVPVWYQAVPLFTASASLVLAWAARVPHRWMLAGIAAAGGVALVGTLAEFQGLMWEESPEQFDLGDRAGMYQTVRRSPADARWAATDAGRPSFWGDRPFVNLDGLVNNRAYQKRLRDQELGDYLNERGVDRLLVVVYDGQVETREPMYAPRQDTRAFSGDYDEVRFWVHAYLGGIDSEVLELPARAEIWRSKPIPAADGHLRYLVFDTSRIFDHPEGESPNK